MARPATVQAPLLLLLLGLVAGAERHEPVGACSDLRPVGGGVREVMMYGRARALAVRWVAAEGAAGRARAALLYAVLLTMGYTNVTLRAPETPRLANSLEFIVKTKCEGNEQPLLQAQRPPGCARASWQLRGEDADSECAFLKVADLPSEWKGLVMSEQGGEGGEAGECAQCTVLVAPAQHAARARQLARRAACWALPMRVILGEPLLTLIAPKNRSLLFFDVPLWIYDRDVQVVRLPACCDTDERQVCSDELDTPIPMEVAAPHFITVAYFAPRIARAIDKFAPSAADIREVLVHEAEDGSGRDIEEAACGWARRNLHEIDLTQEVLVTYSIRVHLCSDDPDYEDYKNMIADVYGDGALGNLTVTVDFKTIDCQHDDAIPEQLFLKQHRFEEQHTVGWLATSVGPAAALQAENIAQPLIAYGAPSVGLRPNGVVRGVTGSVRVLARGYLHLLERCGVRRLAVLSDRTPFADELTDIIAGGDLVMRQRNVTSAETIESALREFRDADVRVYFVNANARVCAEVVCAAEAAGMAVGADYLWLVREWREAGRCGAGELRPLGLGLAWRGAAGSEWLSRRAGPASRLDARWSHRAWPPLAAPLLDGLLLLRRAVEEFVGSRPDSAYDRRVFGNAQNFDTAISGTKFKGITQELVYNKSTYELSSVVLFVERWAHSQRTLLAVWEVSGADVRELDGSGAALCAPAVAADRAASACYTTHSGDEFAIKCHDNAWWITITVLAVTPVALTYARRARLHRLKLRDLALLEQLQEQRKNNSSKFRTNLVSRNEFELREELGFGAYGRVRAAVLRRPGAPALAVAAKEPAVERLQDEADLIREASVLASLKHKNIIRFVGVCLDGRALFFMEYAFFGDLRHYLRARRHLAQGAGLEGDVGNDATEKVDATEAVHISAAALTKLAREAAAALEYLETRRIVHRDIRAANCLVDEARNLKLADFGLARHFAKEEEEYIWQNLRRLPAACMAPESLLNGVFSTASDVWALGVLMLELVTLGEPPYGHCGTEDIMELVRAGVHPPLPLDASSITRHLLEWCWQRCPSKRPSAAQVRASLHQHSTALPPALLCAAPPARPRTPPPALS